MIFLVHQQRQATLNSVLILCVYFIKSANSLQLSVIQQRFSLSPAGGVTSIPWARATRFSSISGIYI